MRRKSRDNGDLLLDKCLEKGQEILKKVEEMNVKPKVTSIKSSSSLSDCKTIERPSNVQFNMQNKLNVSIDVVDSAPPSANTVNKCTMHSAAPRPQPQPQQVAIVVEPVKMEAEIPKNKVKSIVKKCNSIESTGVCAANKVTKHISVVSITPPIQSPPVTTTTTSNTIDRDEKYQSDCSDDSGHMSNESEPISIVPAAKSLIEKFEQNCRKNATIGGGNKVPVGRKVMKNEIVITSNKVIDKKRQTATLEIGPDVVQAVRCKSEVNILGVTLTH
jgi:hypothetical protein